MSEQIKKIIAKQFMDIADGIETGSFKSKPVIVIAAADTEHGMDNILEGARLAEKAGCKTLVVSGEDAHKKMELLLESGEAQGAVTMHYPFPIGVSTVGRVITPAAGKEMFLANTTGTSDTDRVAGMVKNTIQGIIAAKACGIENPTVGIANIEGARQTEKALYKLRDGGYPINFTESARADGGVAMRGNDLLQGTSDVMVMDALTGNLMMKIFSSYTTGGSYESLGFGYGPGIGDGYENVIMIVSRASGAPVIANAVKYATELIENNVVEISRKEFEAAKKAGLDKVIEEIKNAGKKAEEKAEEIKCPDKEPVPYGILGVEVMDLEDAAQMLWGKGIYAETGMGCTGPVILVSDANGSAAEAALREAEYIV